MMIRRKMIKPRVLKTIDDYTIIVDIESIELMNSQILLYDLAIPVLSLNSSLRVSAL